MLSIIKDSLLAKLDAFWTSEGIEHPGMGEDPHLQKSNQGNMHTEKCCKKLGGHFTSTSTGKDTKRLCKAYDTLLCKAVAAKLKYRMFYCMHCGASFFPPHVYLLQKGVSFLMKKHPILNKRQCRQFFFCQGLKCHLCTTPPPHPSKPSSSWKI